MHQTVWVHPVVLVFSIVVVLLVVSNFTRVKRMVIGRPMRTRELESRHNRLLWYIALPILSADLYSSVAYGPEAGATEFAFLGRPALWILIPMVMGTVLLLIIIVLSYIMGVLAYPNGGGGYSIARDNFKKPWVSLVAASALLIDYVLTVAVSVSSGIQALCSAYPALAPSAVTLSVVCVFMIFVVNLRGVSESAVVFAWPNFAFMAMMLFLIGRGIMDNVQHGFVQPSTPPFGIIPHGLTILILLKAFSAACSSLTGIETISNAVPIFRDPRQRSAIKAYVAMAIITGVTLLGFGCEVYVKGLTVNPRNTLLSQLSEAYFGQGPIYQVITWMTFLVLIIAANSIYTGFPQLLALAARDGFLPRALTLRGDRLGYSNGMIVLTALASLLIVVFQAQTNALIPLFTIGVFVSFTIAQIGMVRRWNRIRGAYWIVKAAMNTFGAVVTALVSVVFAITKFTQGAWMVIVAIPVLIVVALMIHRHYDKIADELRIDVKTVRPHPHHVVSVILISDVHQVVVDAVSFVQSIHTDAIALYIGFDEESIRKMEVKWEEWGSPCRLVALKSEFRTLLHPITRFINALETREGHKPDHIQLIIPVFVPSKWWHYLLHNQTAIYIRAWFLRHKNVVVTTVPFHLS